MPSPRPPRRPRPAAPALAALAAALAAAGPALRAQAVPNADPLPAAPPPVVSMGQPRVWQPYAAAVGAFGGPRTGAGLTGGVYRDAGSPVNGVLGLAAEAYGTAPVAPGARGTAGARLLGVTRALNLGYGLDYDAGARDLALVLSWNTAVRRGGLLGRGTALRADWLPWRGGARGGAVNVGLSLPLAQPYAGRTRPRDTGVALDAVAAPARAPALAGSALAAALPAGADSALALVRGAARVLRVYTNFWSERNEESSAEDVAELRRRAREGRAEFARRAPQYAEGRDYAAAARAYHENLARAFALALADSAAGVAAGARARAGLLAHVLLPYDALFGRVKGGRAGIAPLLGAARADFRAWLADSAAAEPARRAAAAAVHDAWLAVIGDQHRALAREWRDSRRVWLPLQFALAPEEHDDQAEIDALVARAVGRPFTGGNAVRYLAEGDVQVEIARSILNARRYHALWVHDFAGRRADGAADEVGFRQVADVYFPALTRAVRRFDSAGALPAYFVYLDQNFYEPAGGRLWMTVLEDPLGADVRVPAGPGAAGARRADSLAAVLRARQAELRRAVAESRGLQALAASRGGGAEGARWLRRTVRVHVSITQPSDWTFRSHRIIPPLPFLPDNLMRDHRKIALYDATEADPAGGAMVVSGVGVGEHYATPTWEDRGLLVRGPAVLEARAALRRLLARNGFSERDVPAPLRPSPGCAADGRCGGAWPGAAEALGTDAAAAGMAPGAGRALQVHNEPGFGAKQASVARAVLYTLAPPGSVIVAPDGLWLGSTWAGMLVGASLRGARVHVIAPALANAPSPGFPQMSRTRDVVRRLLQVREAFGPEIAGAGGDLRVGLYNDRADVNDAGQQARAMRDGFARAPWLGALVPLRPEVLALLDSVPDLLTRAGYRPVAFGRDLRPRLPQLHRKTQLVADAGAVAALAARPEWRALAEDYFRREAEANGPRVAVDSASAARVALATRLLEGAAAERAPGERARLSLYLTVGTQNQDPRGMMLDAEAVVVLSGASAVGGFMDMASLMARTTWLDSVGALDALLPPYPRWQRWVGRVARFVL